MHPSILKLLLATLFIMASCNNTPKQNTSIKEVIEQPSITITEVKKTEKKKSIIFFGDSLTAGFGLDEEESFPSLIQNRIDSLGLKYNVVNAGLSGETSAGGKGRIEWVLNNPVDVFVLELGANDMLRGLSLTETDKNLRDILDVVKAQNSEASIIVAGMEAPPNMGKDYVDNFKNIFHTIAKDYEAGLIPFLLAGLEGKPEMSIGDGKHPNAEGQKIVTENVWNVLKAYL